jgi:ABC-type sugar transport system ATPase subunit
MITPFARRRMLERALFLIRETALTPSSTVPANILASHIAHEFPNVDKREMTDEIAMIASSMGLAVEFGDDAADSTFSSAQMHMIQRAS